MASTVKIRELQGGAGGGGKPGKGDSGGGADDGGGADEDGDDPSFDPLEEPHPFFGYIYNECTKNMPNGDYAVVNCCYDSVI